MRQLWVPSGVEEYQPLQIYVPILMMMLLVLMVTMTEAVPTGPMQSPSANITYVSQC